MARVFIGLGSNLGDRPARLTEAVDALGRMDGCRLLQTSRFYETEPVGGPPQGRYLNAVTELETALAPLALLTELQAIEAAAGRAPTRIRNSPRELDLDLLLYGDEVLETDRLTLPHPRLHLRSFVLEPLAELAGDLIHPTLGLTITELARRIPTQQRGRS